MTEIWRYFGTTDPQAFCILKKIIIILKLVISSKCGFSYKKYPKWYGSKHIENFCCFNTHNTHTHTVFTSIYAFINYAYNFESRHIDSIDKMDIYIKGKYLKEQHT